MEKNSAQSNGSNGENNVLMAVLCYLGLLILIPLVTDAKNDPYVKFHIKQGLLLLIAGAGVCIISAVLFFSFLRTVLIILLFLCLLGLAVTGIVNAVTGKKEVLPLVGKYTDQVKV